MRWSLLIASLILAARGLAQEGSFELFGGAVAGRVNLKSFDAFVTSYNEANRSQLDDELDDLGLSTGWQAGVAVHLTDAIGLSFSFMKQNATCSAALDDGTLRHFKHTFYTPLNLGIPITVGVVEIQPRLGFSQAHFRSWTEYEDGTISFGKERLLNGNYRTYGLFGGIDLAVRIPLGKVFRLAVGGSFQGVSGSDYTDPNWARALDVQTFHPDYLPTDYALWLDLAAQNELPSYDVEEAVKFKGTYYYGFASLVINFNDE